jgi:hypothetical protein
MDPVTATVAAYIAMKMVDQFIVQEGYGFVKRLFFSKTNYADKLYQIIEETASDYEKDYPVCIDSEKIPFYQSQPIFELLNQHILFDSIPAHRTIVDEFKKYPNVIAPTESELDIFYNYFCSKINECKEIKKLHIEDNYKENIFKIGDSLFELKLMIESIDKKLTFTLDQEWLDRKCNEAIADLGGRYTPELNLKLDIAEVFDGIGRTERLSKIVYEKFDSLLIKGNKLKSDDETKDSLNAISENIQFISNLYGSTSLTGVLNYPVNEFIVFLERCLTAVTDTEATIWKWRESQSDNKGYGDKYSTLHRELREFEYECETLKTFLNSTTIRLVNNPFLLLEGEAGIGKSHLIADIVKNRISVDSASLLILGQHLTVDESPWTQIFRRLEINITTDEFLDKLNLYGEHTGKKLIIFVDAINEGSGNKFWPDYINSFIDAVREYDWLGLVFTVRTTYKNITISAEQLVRNKFELHKHIGFKNVEMDAVNLFFDNFHIERPSAPLLNPEFKNPLFLKLFCEGIKKKGLSRVPKGLEGITSILDFFVEGVNTTIGAVKRQHYDSSFNCKRSVKR